MFRFGRPSPRRFQARSYRPQAELLEARCLLATLFPGNPVTPGTPLNFSGSGTAAVQSAISAFEAGIGGANNGGGAATNSGFRVINWDAVKLDGTDFGGNSVVISQGKTVGIPVNRFQSRGVFFDTIYAVGGDGFASVNPAATGLFPAFSPNNTFAMFNDTGIDFSFVEPTGTVANDQAVSAGARGFGAVFINVETPNTTSIEYFHGNQSLGKFFVPVGAQAQPEFLGELFATPIVTRVSLTLGTDVLFNFNGITVTPGGTNNPPTHNLVVTDDFIYPEPVPLSNGVPPVTGTPGLSSAASTITAQVGTPFTGTVATFSSNDPTQTAKSFFAVINWGDGHVSNGTITANSSGGFDVKGTNTYTRNGLFGVSVDIQDFSGGALTVTNTAAANAPLIVTGSDAGIPPIVKAFLPDGTQEIDFAAYNPAFLGGVRVALGDINGDGNPDIVTAPGPGGGPDIKVFDGRNASLVGEFSAFNPNFTGGSYVAVADVNNDGFADIICGADAGGGPNVVIWDGKTIGVPGTTPKTVANFFPFDTAFTGGVRVASADFNGDGFADIVTSAGPGGGPSISVFDGKALTTRQPLSGLAAFFAFAQGFTGGTYPGTGDVNGDGTPDIVVGAGAGGGPNVTAFNGKTLSPGVSPDVLFSFFPYAQAFTGGVRVAAADLNNDGKADVVTGAGTGGGPNVTVFDPVALNVIDSFFAYNQTFTGGIFVAASNGSPLRRPID